MTDFVQVGDQRLLDIDDRRNILILNNKIEVVLIHLNNLSATATFYALYAEIFDQSDIFFGHSLFYTLFYHTNVTEHLWSSPF